MPSLFEPEGDAWSPTPLARGPWDPGALHGGPAAALVARELESIPPPGPMLTARLTLELLRPVPFAPLTVRAETVRPGRRVQLLAATLEAGGQLVCRALALRIRREPEPVAELPAPDLPPGAPGEGRDESLVGGLEDSFGGTAVEHRWVSGGWGVGPGTLWMRLKADIIPDEEPSGLQRAAALADFGNGVAAAVPWETHQFINPDLTVYLEREPAGEWLALDAVTRADPAGTGVAESVLSDTRGRVGRGLQALYIARR